MRGNNKTKGCGLCIGAYDRIDAERARIVIKLFHVLERARLTKAIQASFAQDYNETLAIALRDNVEIERRLAYIVRVLGQ